MIRAAPRLNKKDPLVEEFLRYLAIERNGSPRTLKAYRQALTAFRAENKTPWKTCTVNDFRDYLFVITKLGQARSYMRLQFSALRTFYQFLAARKGLRCNPLREVQLPKIDKKLPLVLTRKQIEELLAAPARVAKNRAEPSLMQLRDAHARSLRKSPQCASVTWTRQPIHDANLHACNRRTAKKSLRRGAPAGMIGRDATAVCRKTLARACRGAALRLSDVERQFPISGSNLDAVTSLDIASE